MPTFGIGFGNTFGSSSVSSELMSMASTEVVLDSSGEFSITLANADLYNLISAVFQEDPTAQSGIYRIDPTNTTALKGRADIGAVANGKTAVITYNLA